MLWARKLKVDREVQFNNTYLWDKFPLISYNYLIALHIMFYDFLHISTVNSENTSLIWKHLLDLFVCIDQICSNKIKNPTILSKNNFLVQIKFSKEQVCLNNARYFLEFWPVFFFLLWFTVLNDSLSINAIMIGILIFLGWIQDNNTLCQKFKES